MRKYGVKHISKDMFTDFLKGQPDIVKGVMTWGAIDTILGAERHPLASAIVLLSTFCLWIYFVTEKYAEDDEPEDDEPEDDESTAAVDEWDGEWDEDPEEYDEREYDPDDEMGDE